MEYTIKTDDEGHIFVPLTDDTKRTMYLVCDDPTLLRHGTKVKLVHVTEEELVQLPIPVSKNVVQPDSPPPSVMTFEDLNLQQQLLDGVYEMGFDTPWEIQERALPTLLADPPQNMIAQSQGGTGKTVAHILAMLSRTDTSKAYPHVVCLVPSADLAIETGEMARKTAQHMNISIKTVVGGEKLKQGHKLAEHILIGTPGKLLEWATHKKWACYDLSKVEVFVLDNATRMSAFADLQKQSIAIQEKLPQTCQMMLFSTTDDEDVMIFAETIIPNNPVVLQLPYVPKELGSLKQRFIVCETNKNKHHFIAKLHGVLALGRAVIFCRSRTTAAWLAKKMNKQRQAVALLSGQLNIEQRINIIIQFRTGEKKVLISTHSLARGMDLQRATDLVINLDLPTYKEGRADCESYHDCIGREALFGPSRVAINLVEGDDPQSMSVLKQIEKHFEVTMSKLDAEVVDEFSWKDLLE